jgi:hypothetical protein
MGMGIGSSFGSRKKYSIGMETNVRSVGVGIGIGIRRWRIRFLTLFFRIPFSEKTKEEKNKLESNRIKWKFVFQSTD